MKIRYKKAKINATTSGMTMEKKIDYATKTLERNIGFINSCDTKTSIVLAIFGVLLTIIFTSDVSTEIIHIINTAYSTKCCCGVLYLILISASIIVLLIGLKNLICVLIGRIDVKGNNSSYKYDSRIFFSGITKYEDDRKYRNNFSKMTEKEYFDEITNQIFINAKIADVKYQKYNWGLKCLVCGFLTFVVVILIGIFAY